MPQAIDLTVKDGSTVPQDATFELVAPAAGYAGIAEWQLKRGDTVLGFPSLTASAQVNSGSRSRQLRLRVRVPSMYTDSTGLPAIRANIEAHLSVTVPDVFPVSERDDATAYIANLIGHAFVRSLIKDAVPAT